MTDNDETHGEAMTRAAALAAEQAGTRWWQTAQFRAWIYGVLVAVLAAAAVWGFLTPEQSDALDKILSAVLLAGAAGHGLAFVNTPKRH